jgi:hypothetical protein
MPIFGRPEGKVIKRLSPLRRILPYLMRTRAESLVYYEQVVEVERAQEFIAHYNEGSGEGSGKERISIFHIILAATGRVLHERPGLNRFVSGGRIYQRNQAELSFSVKKSFDDNAPLLTVKLPFSGEEKVGEVVEKIRAEVGEVRTGPPNQAEKESSFFLKVFPGVLMRLFVGLARALDGINLLPSFMIKGDPLYASVFLANLGSLGLDRVWHHLYEWGNIPLFCAIGKIDKGVVVGPDDAPVVRNVMRLRWTFDERINDGFYCVKTLELLKGYIEDPQSLQDAGPIKEVSSR